MTIDTNILVAYFDDDKAVIQAFTGWRYDGRPLFLSAIVEAELLSYSKWNDLQLRVAQDFLRQNFTSVPFDAVTAGIVGRIRRKKKMKFPDAGIAATALYTNTPLLTRNVNDFKNIEGLEVISI